MHTCLKQLFVGSALFTVILSCGNEEKAKDYSGSVGSCSYSVGEGDAKLSTCTEYSYSGSLKKDPASTSKSLTEDACKTSNAAAVFKEGGTCPTTNVPGTCTVTSSATESGETFTFNAVLFLSGTLSTSEIAEKSCTDVKGVWKKL